MRNQRRYAEIHSFDARGRAHDVTMVKGQHHGVARLGIEYPREAILHPPREVGRAPQEKAGRFHGRINTEILLEFSIRFVADYLHAFFEGCS